MSSKTTVTLELTTAEANFLAGVLINTVLFDSPAGKHASDIYDALVDGAEADDFKFSFNQEGGRYFMARKA